MSGALRESRRHTGFAAFLVHRVSGLALALFLPVHFLVLGLAVRDDGALDGFLRWTESGAVKLAETGLVVLLAVHLTGGLRVLAIEFLPWSDRQKAIVATAFGAAAMTGLLFALNAT